jgi:ABC-type antimicrobial peptide transport system permease subunit
MKVIPVWIMLNVVVGVILGLIFLAFAVDTKKWRDGTVTWMLVMALLNGLFWIAYVLFKVCTLLAAL